MNTALRIFLLSTAAMVPLATASAADDEFSIDEASAHKKQEMTYLNWIEAGWGYNSNSRFQRGQYTGLVEDEGFFLGSFGLLYRDPEGRLFARSYGTDLGLNSRRIEAEAGKQGQFRAGMVYDQTPSYKFQGSTPYTNAGSNDLKLPPGWVTGANTPDLTALPGSLRTVDIKQERTRYGMNMAWTMLPGWTLSSKVEHETKEGIKALGIVWGTGGGGPAAITPEPVDYRTDRMDVAVAYAGTRGQMQVGYQLSLFNNEQESLRVENPFSTGAPVGAYQLAPDNTAHQITLAGGYNLTPDTRVNANFAHGYHLQDDDFLPYSTRVTAATPRRSLDGKIINTVANLELATRPTPKMNIRTKYRYTNRDNETPRDLYLYAINDAAAQNGAASAQARYNMPYSFEEHFASAETGYRITSGTKVTAGYDLRAMERSYSEVEQTIEHTGRLQARSKLADSVTGNAKYARAWRSGSAYVFDRPFEASRTTAFIDSGASLTDYQHHPLLRMFHMADRVKDNFSAGLTYTPAPEWQMGLNGGLTIEDYQHSQLGVTGIKSSTATLDVSHSPRDGLTAYGFYTYERRATDIVGWSWSNAGQAADTGRRWWMDMRDSAHTVGLGTKAKVTDSLTLSADYSYSHSVTDFSPAANGTTIAFTALGDVPTRIHNVGFNAVYDVTETFSVGVGYAVEFYDSTDWANVGHQTVNRVLTMGEQPPDYIAHLVAASVKMKF